MTTRVAIIAAVLGASACAGSASDPLGDCLDGLCDEAGPVRAPNAAVQCWMESSPRALRCERRSQPEQSLVVDHTALSIRVGASPPVVATLSASSPVSVTPLPASPEPIEVDTRFWIDPEASTILQAQRIEPLRARFVIPELAPGHSVGLSPAVDLWTLELFGLDGGAELSFDGGLGLRDATEPDLLVLPGGRRVVEIATARGEELLFEGSFDGRVQNGSIPAAGTYGVQEGGLLAVPSERLPTSEAGSSVLDCEHEGSELRCIIPFDASAPVGKFHLDITTADGRTRSILVSKRFPTVAPLPAELLPATLRARVELEEPVVGLAELSPGMELETTVAASGPVHLRLPFDLWFVMFETDFEFTSVELDGFFLELGRSSQPFYETWSSDEAMGVVGGQASWFWIAVPPGTARAPATMKRWDGWTAVEGRFELVPGHTDLDDVNIVQFI